MNTNMEQIDAALAECRQLLADQTWAVERLREENSQLRLMLLSELDPLAIRGILLANDGNLWRTECLNMQQSLSWRITKPLRLIKKTLEAFRTLGFRNTCGKIVQYLKNEAFTNQ